MLEEIKDPESVDCIYDATLIEKGDHNDSMLLTVKCIWASAAIDTNEAKEFIKILSNSENENVMEAAKNYL